MPHSQLSGQAPFPLSISLLEAKQYGRALGADQQNARLLVPGMEARLPHDTGMTA